MKFKEGDKCVCSVMGPGEILKIESEQLLVRFGEKTVEFYPRCLGFRSKSKHRALFKDYKELNDYFSKYK